MTMMYQGESAFKLPSPFSFSQKKSESKSDNITDAIGEALTYSIKKYINEEALTLKKQTHCDPISLSTVLDESTVLDQVSAILKESTVSDQVSTVLPNIFDLPTEENNEDDSAYEELLANAVNMEQFEPTEQYDSNGRPVEFPFPPEFLPPTPKLSTGESWQEDVVSEEEFNIVKESMCLPALPETYRAMEAPHVPKDLVEMSSAYILYMCEKKSANDIGKARDSLAKLSQTARGFYAQYGIYAEDKFKKLVNWKTVFYVAHLLRTIPSAEAYTVDDDLFSRTQGLREYNLNNWHANKTHAIRMVVIADLTEENVEAVLTLDLLMRFRRSRVGGDESITFHNLGEGIQRNQSLCFVNYLLDDGSMRASWLSIGLDKKIASQIKPSLEKPYYDGPYCQTCFNHHVKLLYCTSCYRTQYCGLMCLKADKRAHKAFCRKNKVDK